MKQVTVIKGVVSEYNGKYWGKQEWDSMDFGDFQNAEISDPEFCKKPTDMTYNPTNTNGHNPAYDKLLNAKLVSVKKTVTVEFELL